MVPDFLTLPNRRLAYQRLIGTTPGPGVVFCGGYASDMTGTKASFLAEHCQKEGCSYLRFDYSGHGQSDGIFKQGTIGAWFEDTLSVFDKLTEGPQIIIGSSMGGWMALMLAVQRPARVKAVVGIAAAPDFTEDLMWMKMTTEQRDQLMRDGFILDDTGSPDHQPLVTLDLIKEARQHLLLRKVIPLSCPVRLLQGMRDTEVPWQHTLRIVENAAHDDVRAIFIKDGDHRLSRPEDLDLMWRTVSEFTP